MGVSALRRLGRPALLFMCLGATATTSGCDDMLGLCDTQLHICNESLTNQSHTISIDGINHGVVEVGKCRDFDVTEGTHALQFKFTNTTQDACSASIPSVEKCGTKGVTCRG